MVNDNGRSVLAREYVVDVLLYLRENNRAICNDLSPIIRSGTTRKNTVRMMREANLITVQKVERPRLTYLIELTDTGAAVADELRRAEDLVRGTRPEQQTNHGSPEVEGSLVNGR